MMEKYKPNNLEKKIQKYIESSIKDVLKCEFDDPKNYFSYLFCGIDNGYMMEDMDLSSKELSMTVNWERMRLFIEDTARGQALFHLSKFQTSFVNEAKEVVNEAKEKLSELQAEEREMAQEIDDEEKENIMEQEQKHKFIMSLTHAQREAYAKLHPEFIFKAAPKKKPAIKKKRVKRK